jgi:hypothetical protein
MPDLPLHRFPWTEDGVLQASLLPGPYLFRMTVSPQPGTVAELEGRVVVPAAPDHEATVDLVRAE